MDNNNYVPSAYPPSYSAAVLPDNVSVEPKPEFGGSIFIPPVTHTGASDDIPGQNHYNMPFQPGFIPIGAPIGHAQNQYPNHLYGQPNYTPSAPVLPRHETAIVATTTHTAQGTTTVYKRHIPKWRYALMAVLGAAFIAGLIWTIVSIVKSNNDFENNKPDWAKNG